VQAIIAHYGVAGWLAQGSVSGANSCIWAAEGLREGGCRRLMGDNPSIS
jgi:hypothetical protein